MILTCVHIDLVSETHELIFYDAVSFPSIQCSHLLLWCCTQRYVVFKGLITVGRELRQQHPSDLLSGAGTSRERSSRDVPAGQQIPSRPWSIPIITWLNNVILHVFTTKKTFKITTKSSDVAYLPPLWRHASLLNDGSCSFTHPVAKGRSARGTSPGT